MTGMVFKREVEGKTIRTTTRGVLKSVYYWLTCPDRCAGTIERATDAKVAVYSCPFDSMATETKGTVLLKTASELKSFSKGDEALIEGVRL